MKINVEDLDMATTYSELVELLSELSLKDFRRIIKISIRIRYANWIIRRAINKADKWEY